MKILYRKLLPFIALIFFLPNWTQASHNMGVDLNYECVQGCTLRINLRAYRDCQGISTIPNVVNFTGSGIGCNQPLPVSPWSTIVITDVTPLCPGASTACNDPGSPNVGVEEYFWFRDYDFCNVNCSTYVYSWNDCCRNAMITSGAASQNMWVGATMSVPASVGCNNSPYFTQDPIFIICAGQTTIRNQGAYDPDGDSLSVKLADCKINATGNVTYNAGFSSTAPLGTSWNVIADPDNGDLIFSANPGNVVVGVICVVIEEWRNGKIIGRTLRDIQVVVQNCATGNDQPILPGITNVTSGQVHGDTLFTCVGKPFCFDIPAIDPNVGDIVTLRWDNVIPGGSFADATNPAIIDSVWGTNPTARFCWTLPNTQTYNFLAQALDDYCPYPGVADKFITIAPECNCLTINAIENPCLLIDFSVSSGVYVPGVTYTWTGGGGLTANPNASDSSFSHTYSVPGTYAYTITAVYPGGCTVDQTDSITVPNPQPIISPAPVAEYCIGDSVQLFGPAGMNSYNWSTGATTQSIWVSTTGKVGLNVVDASTCLTVGQEITVNEINIVASIFPGGTLTMCPGSQVAITASPPGQHYLWSNLDTTATTTVQDSGIYYCTVTHDIGCTDISNQLQISWTAGPLSSFTYGGLNLTLTPDFFDNSTGSPIVWFWQFGDGLTSTLQNPSHTFAAPGTYWVCLLANDGSCSHTWCDSVTVPLVLIGDEGGVPNVEEVLVAPNPFTGFTTIQINISNTSEVLSEVYTVDGKKVATLMNDRLTAGSYKLNFDAQQLGTSSGIYFLRTRINDKVYSQKLLDLGNR